MEQSRPVRRIITRMMAVGLTAAVISGCATESPAEQGERERKAASIAVFKLHMAKDLWTRTSNGNGHAPIENPKSLVEQDNGMVTIELTGPQLVDYLKMLDYNAHGGMSARDEPLAVTVYDTLAPVVDRIQAPPIPGAPAPEITIDAGLTTTTSAPPN